MDISALLYAGLIILQIITCNMLFSDYVKDYVDKFEEKRLQLAVNYSSEAAALMMKDNSANLEQDYEILARLNVDPIVAMDTFSMLMCKNYEIPISSTNQQQFMLDYCPVFLVASYDGYYIASRQEINSSGVENIVFSPKFPFLDQVTHVNDNGDEINSIFSYNMSLDTALRLDENGDLVKDTDLPVSKRRQLDSINETITDVLNEHLLEYAHSDPRGEIFIPAEVNSIMSTNPIANTSVIAYIDNFDMVGLKTNLQSFGIGGAKIKQKDVVVGFEVNVNGNIEKHYCYSKDMPDWVTPLEIFDSQQQAAEAGYYYHIIER